MAVSYSMRILTVLSKAITAVIKIETTRDRILVPGCVVQSHPLAGVRNVDGKLTVG